MNDLQKRIEKARQLINDAEYIVIGAGAGLSEAAGFHYAGERYDDNFSDFKKKYGIGDMYTGTFYNFKTEEEKWAFWARVIQCNVYDTHPTPLYQKLRHIVKDKKYFVITTNADHQFFINGFNMNSYFETQGNYIYLQCQKGCHNKVYYNKDMIQQMIEQTKDCKIPHGLVPRCPVCGKKMDVHVRKDQFFVETDVWKKNNEKYAHFLRNALYHKVVFLEFGVGFNTPGIIRYPFEQMVYQNEDANLIRFNRDYPLCLKGNEKNVLSFSEDILSILEKINGENNDESKTKRNVSY